MPKALVAVLAAILLPAAFAQPPSPGGDPALLVHIASESPPRLKAALDAQGYDVSCLGCGAGHVEAIVSEAEHGALAAAGYTLTTISMAEPYQDIVAREGGLPAGYNDLASINALLFAAEAAHPTLAKVYDIAALYGPGGTIEGRPIFAIKVSDNVLADEQEPNVLVAACHHSREIGTPELALDAMNRLLAGYGTDPQLTAVVDQNEIWIIPVQNPDGLHHTWTVNNLWRKNRRPNAGGSFGVDLNRNYPLGWSSTCGGSTSPSNDTYKGTAPASEPETQTMIAFSRARRFAKVLDFHSYGREVLQSYLCSPIPPAIEGFVDSEAVALSIPATYGVRDPSADGEHQEWQIAENTSYSFLVEIDQEFQPPYANTQIEINRVWPLVLDYLNRPIPLRGRVTDLATGAPIQADITVAGIAWSNGETRKSRTTDGLYHLFLPAGNWSVTFSAAGYQPFVVPVAIGPAALTVDVQLIPSAGPFTMQFSTSGGGAGDLHVGFDNVPYTTASGYTLFSFQTPGPVGGGNLGGLYADLFTIQILTMPASAGFLFHWTWPAPGLFPDTPFDLPAGALPLPTGFAVDGVGVAITSVSTLAGLTPVVRATF